ncbi:MAG: class I SAM-dependent DNA methyltransferase [Anaerolineae bacterium]
MPMSAQEFVHKWRNVELKERSASQAHFLDLCRLVGHDDPITADPVGDWFTFERGATKVSGGDGFADVWKKGFFGWEYKGRHANLDAAYEQLLQYRESLENPPLLVVADTDVILIHTNFTNTLKRVERVTLEDLLQPERLAVLRAVFHDPERLRSPRTPNDVTEDAARQFSRLADLMRQYGEDPQRAAHFLIRLLFCLFAEDIELLPGGVFSHLVLQTHNVVSAFTQQLRQLFTAMRGGGWFGAERIPYFDGGLFDSDDVLDLGTDGLDILTGVVALDWSAVEPSILGTLFERSLDPSRRAQLGAHYTGKDDILLIVEPVLMAPLRRRWQEVQEQARATAAKRDEAGGQKRQHLEDDLRRLLQGFAAEVSQVRVLDPACGSSNFLYVALRQLLGLWKEVSQLSSKLLGALMLPTGDLAPSPAQLHGIEVSPYAHELAQATVWIGYIQWLKENGFGQPVEPILRPLHNVVLMDAVLAHDDAGKPVEPEWPAADVIIGNPPFLGSSRLRRELGEEHVERLFTLYRDRVPGAADLVCYWFEKARAAIERGQAKRAGLLATQAIRGGANRRVLQRIRETGDIFYAQADRPWILDGAAVHVSMVGFDGGTETARLLDGRPVAAINADLTAGLDLSASSALKGNAGICFRSDEKGGPFDISEHLARVMLAAPQNPNGRPNSDVIRPYCNARDVLQRPRGVWIIDFGPDMGEEAAALYEMPFEYVRRVVRPVRMAVRSERERTTWWLHRRPAPDLRVALEPLPRYLATPSLAKHRLFVWLPRPMLPDHQLIVFARDDDYFLGVLHSRPHELWARGRGTQLREVESGFRYTPTTTFETFPFPWLPGKEPQGDARVEAIAAAARELVLLRDRWLNPEGATEDVLKERTLTKLYNKRPTWLEQAHRRLDEAVFAAYGWPADLADEEVLARLLALNHARAG